MKRLRLGTRGSALALWQAHHIADLLRQAWDGVHVEIVVITTTGDTALDKPLAMLGGKGVFTAELEAALHSGELDCAVHSLKDLPTAQPTGLTLAAVPKRGSVQDVLVSRASYTLETLPQGARLGTGSLRRAAQLLYYRTDLQIMDIHGNVDTRINKALAADGAYDAIVLAQAGIDRLGRTQVITQTLPLDQVLPAPGQGALAVQCRDDDASLKWFTPITHAETEAAVTAERAFLAGLGSGCALPVAAYGQVEGGRLQLRGRVLSPDGKRRIDVSGAGEVNASAAAQLGNELAREALARGGKALMEAP
jgi:hydroxymethylbilane synthase